jgi:single-strand DNA-binding protein
MSLNKVMLIGLVGQDPQLRSVPNSQPVVNFSVATDQAFTDKDGNRQQKTEWHNIVGFGHTAELVARYLKKGRQVFVEGRLQTREYEGQDKTLRSVTEIVAQRVEFLGTPIKDEPAGGEDNAD